MSFVILRELFVHTIKLELISCPGLLQAFFSFLLWARETERRSRYELHLPYTIVLRLGWGGQRGMVYFFASQPVAADRCAGYVIIGRNYNLDQSERVIREFEDTIFGQDQVVVESQRPERVPFDLADELHLKFDAVAVAYRKAMRALGLARPAAGPPNRAGWSDCGAATDTAGGAGSVV